MVRKADAAPKAETPAALASFANAPIVVAALALAGAVAAVARFPNQPVPGPLVDRITNAQRAFETAAADFTIAPGQDAPAYDDAWIKTALEELDARLKAKFDSIGGDLAALSDRLAALEAARTGASNGDA